MKSETKLRAGLCLLIASIFGVPAITSVINFNRNYISNTRVETSKGEANVLQRTDGNIEVIYGLGSRLSDTDGDRTADSNIYITGNPFSFMPRVAKYQPVTEKDQEFFSEAISKSDLER